MAGIESFNTNAGGINVVPSSPQLQLQPQTQTPTQLPFAEPPAPPRKFEAKLPPPKFVVAPVVETLTSPQARFAGGVIGKLGGGSPVVTTLKTGVAAIQAGWALGEYLDEQNQPKYNSAPMPSSYGQPEALQEPEIGVIGYSVQGVYLIDDGGEYAFGAETGSRPSVYVTSIPTGTGGSNGNGAVVTLDDKGAVAYGSPESFYSTNCRQSLCGVKGYRIDKLIPKYADGTVGKNQATPKPHYTTDPDYTSELSAPAAKPASQPKTETPNSSKLKPGEKLAPGQKTSSTPSSSSQPEPKTPPRPDLSKQPDPAPTPLPLPNPQNNYTPAPTGFAPPKTSNLNPPSPTIDLSKSPSSTPSSSPSPAGAPKKVPSPVGSPNLQPDPCEPNPCMSSMNSTIGDLWDMLQYLLGLLEDKEADVNVIVCDCVDGSPVYTSKELSVLKGNEASTILQCYEIATTKGLVCLGSKSTVSSSKPIPPVEIEVPVIQCEAGVPVSYKLKIPVAKGSELKTYSYFNELAEIKRQNCILGTTIGVDDFPASLPASLISKDEGFLGNLIPNENVEITSLTKLFAWYIERFDEVVGQFEIPIVVKDSDAATPGDQPQGFKLPNIAESIAEIMGLMLQTSYNSEALLNIAVRSLIEGGTDKIQNYKSYMLLQSLVDYTGFKYDEEQTTIPMTFTPGKEKLDEMLVDYQQPIQVAQFNEKLGLPDDLRKFSEAWSIIKATHFRKVDTSKGVVETAANIMNIIKGLQGTLNKVNEEPGESLPHEDSDQFYEEVESGFINEPGATNTTDPYGLPFNERPKIREIGIE